MATKKYDWSNLKLEFFQSDFDDVKSFLSHFWVTFKWGGWIAKQTKWRAKEKQEYKEKILKKALEVNAEKQAKSLELDIEVLKKGKKNGLIQIVNKLSKKDKKWNIIELSVSDLVKAINTIKVELWEPTSYNKNENLNKDVSFTWIEIHHVWKDGKTVSSDWA